MSADEQSWLLGHRSSLHDHIVVCLEVGRIGGLHTAQVGSEGVFRAGKADGER